MMFRGRTSLDTQRSPLRPGTTALELVCVLPVLIAIVLGAADFGRLAHFDNVLSNAARVGAQYGATHRRTALNAGEWEQRLIAVVTEEAAHLPGFDADRFAVVVDASPEPDGGLRISVAVTYPFETIVDWPGIPGEIEITPLVAFVEYR